MGFFKSFFAALAANNISEKKRTEQERIKLEQERRDNASKIIKLQMNFYDFQSQINCNNASFKEIVSDYDIENDNVSSNDVLRTEQLFNGYKQQLKEFISYGGNPIYICDFNCDSNKMDLYIKIVKLLKEYDWLDKQEKYVKYADDTYWLEQDLEEEQEKKKWLSILFDIPSNEFKSVIKKECQDFISYDNITDTDAIILNEAYFCDYLHNGDGGAWDAPISIKLTNNHILFYNSITHEEIYYKSTISNTIVEVLGTKFVTDWASVDLNGVYVLIKMTELEKIQHFYNRHNSNIIITNRQAYNDINSLSGIEFEGVCKRLLENMGFSVETTKATGDGGIDLIAYNSQPLLSGKYIVQCKRYIGSVGEPVIRDLYGVIMSERANKGILMTSGAFTKQARLFAEDKPIELIDGIKLKELLKNF